MHSSNEPEDHLEVFWPGSAGDGINAAIGEKKRIVCFFTGMCIMRTDLISCISLYKTVTNTAGM